MATIMMGWELGEGLGHVQRLLHVGRALAARGHQPVFALSNVVECWPLFQKEPFRVVQAPFWNFRQRRSDQPFLASSLADVLAVRGWEFVDTLRPLVAAWHNLVDYVQPKLIVTDFSPTLCLAAYQSVPVVQVGNWFTMAPVHASTFPLLAPGNAPVISQAELLKVVQEVQRLRGHPIPPTLTSVLADGKRFPTFYSEIDPYQAERTEPVWDPLEPMPPLLDTRAESRFFAYLSGHNPTVEPFLTQMALTGCKGTVYIRSASVTMKERLRLQGLTVLDEPAKIDDMLAQSAVIVHHGGSLGNSAFAAGRPQILLPQHLEQVTTAQLLARLGVALFLLSNSPPDAAGRALKQMLTDPRYAQNAIACARRLRERPRRPALPAIVECCEQHLV